MEKGGVEWVDETKKQGKRHSSSLGMEDLKASRWVLGPRDGGKIGSCELPFWFEVQSLHPMTKSQVKSSQVDFSLHAKNKK